MNLEQVKTHSLHLAALYAMLAQDMAGKSAHNIDAHNLCSAVIEHDGRVLDLSLIHISEPTRPY